jgi:hypothetical protein
VHERWASVVGILVALSPRLSQAGPLFEPTDLEMEKTGWLDVDLQVGPMRGPDAWRLVVPDMEIDLGLWSTVELDLDAAYAIESNDDTRFTLDHPAPDNIWIAAKLGLGDWRTEGSTHAWGLGLQLGPKVPVARDAHGVGYEALFLFGYTWGESHLVLNLGGRIDPGGQVGAERPIAAEGGLDLDVESGLPDLSVTGEIGTVLYVSPDPDELHMTAGLKWSPNENLDLSVVGLFGFLPGGDQAGILFGVSPKFQLWR